MQLKTMMAVGIGGVIGTLLRYTISLFISTSSGFPLATFLINISGCFILSFLLTYFGTKWDKPPLFMTAISVGVIGSFTTFSTFAVEVVHLLQTNYFLAILYCFCSLIGGILLSYSGYYVAQVVNN
ncbi:MAG TPA: fluoride efflux transporter CrcB [Cerasibacillus sp.]|uniref:fluoride efflux transporter CrcB n=1 Tax=Cerasibacillus sp. TaxID=2498711 RepID=UPI002F3EC254